MDNYMQFIHQSRYARWLPEDGRRETWDETVGRYCQFFFEDWKHPDTGSYPKICSELQEAITNMDVMPSMRAFMSAGKALERDNVAGYNCAFVAIDHVRAFDETMYILMCGTGVGFSVERQHVSRLPSVPSAFSETDEVVTVRDSKIGWASAFRTLIKRLYKGRIPNWNVDGVRPSGAPLKTFGGRASGPEPLVDLFAFTVGLFRKAQGRKLTSLEVHDLVCKIADIVVSGGVRRSALISLSNLSDDRMRGAKSGNFGETEPQRYLANNSAVYTDKPSLDVFLKEWVSLYESKSGERGIFSRAASNKQAAKNGRRAPYSFFGTNPCSEIILRSCQFCNLTEVVVRSTDTLDDLKRKVRQATILGTLQSSLTEFRYLRKIWRQNCEEERLLGVSLTGIMDHPVLSGSRDWCVFEAEDVKRLKGLGAVLEELKNVAIETNKDWAAKLGINPSAAITCVKPSGTVSQLVDSASGIHSRFSPCYTRRVRAAYTDPLTQLMIDQGVPHEPCVVKPDTTVIFSFPIKAPEGAKVVADDTAIQQLEIWKIYQDHWCEHKPSITVYYTDEEYLDVGSWVYNNLDDISGISFLPKDDHVYRQAPYESISDTDFTALKEVMPEIDFSKLHEYEEEDLTLGSQTSACSGGVCEIVDIT